VATVLLEIDPADPQPWLLARAVDVLRKGGVVVLPTDTVYGLTCTINHPAAIERIYALKDLDPKKPLSILVRDQRMVSRYARGVTTPVYRLLKRVLPGPYTFIFRATDEVPKIMLRKRKTIGIRIPDTPIVLAILDQLDEPLLTTSILTPEDQYLNDPLEIERVYGRWVDLVVDGGVLVPNPSTVVDLSGEEPILVREGKGDLASLEMFE
jgi:tRNA threonylcarbamoyl adenosine modification protein (Sua5/YciO/YrdC/YwlC family)